MAAESPREGWHPAVMPEAEDPEAGGEESVAAPQTAEEAGGATGQATGNNEIATAGDGETGAEDAEAGARVEAGADMESGVDMETGADMEAGTDMESGANPEAHTDIESGADHESGEANETTDVATGADNGPGAAETAHAETSADDGSGGANEDTAIESGNAETSTADSAAANVQPGAADEAGDVEFGAAEDAAIDTETAAVDDAPVDAEPYTQAETDAEAAPVDTPVDAPEPAQTDAAPSHDAPQHDASTAASVPPPASPPPGPAPDSSKTHSRPDSFARTVSEGLNWNDDEEGSDFALSRTNTNDPFKFMAPSDRSNSFPDVPPPAREEGQTPQPHPLRQSAGEDLFGAPEPAAKEEDGSNFFASGDAGGDDFFGAVPAPAADSPATGGGVYGAADTAADDFFGSGDADAGGLDTAANAPDEDSFFGSGQPQNGDDFFGSGQPEDDADLFDTAKPEDGSDFFGGGPAEAGDGDDFFASGQARGDGGGDGDGDDFFNSASQEPHEAAPRPAVSFDVLGQDGDNEAARFEEGMPLIRHDTADEDAADRSPDFGPDDGQHAPPRRSTFATVSSPEDEFFNNVQDTPQSGDSTFAPSLGRKSTMQVTGMVDDEDSEGEAGDDEGEAPGGGDDEGKAPGGGDDEDKAQGGGDNELSPKHHTQEEENDPDWQTEPSSVVTGATPDLSAVAPGSAPSKWEAAFGDNDDSFLPDTTMTEVEAPADAAPKTLDPTDLFGSDDEGFLELDDDFLPSDDEPAQQTSDPAPARPVGPSKASSRYLPQAAAAPPSQPASSTPYLATGITGMAAAGASSLYGPPQQSVLGSPAFPTSSTAPAPSPYATQQYGAPPVQPPPSQRAESFADKARGGYSSPYDLPSDLVARKPQRAARSRAPSGTPQGPPAGAPPYGAPSGPPAGAPYASPAAPPLSIRPSPGAPYAGMPGAPPLAPSSQPYAAPPPPQANSLKLTAPGSQSGFFEELPMAPRSRPVSRGRASPPKQDPHADQPSMLPPDLTSPTEVMPSMGSLASMGGAMGGTMGGTMGPAGVMGPAGAVRPAGAMAPPPMTPQTQINRYAPSPVPNLVAPEKVNPYAPSQQSAPPSGVSGVSSAASRYSPAPAQKAPSSVPPPPANRYSPAAPGRAASYGGTAAANAHPHPHPHPHMPRTSSPLAHFEITHEKAGGGLLPSSLEHPDRNRSVSAYEPRGGRVALPPTREEDEGASAMQTLSPEQAYDVAVRHTPPPGGGGAHDAVLSPPKRQRANYMPQQQQQQHPTSHQSSHHPHQPGLAPPVRSQTMSPGGSFQRSASREPPPRPASVQSAHVGPTFAGAAQVQGHAQAQSHAAGAPRRTNTSFAPSMRPRGLSATFDLVPPSDERQHDPLQRWKGTPLISWGVGGSVVTVFPKDVPRYLPNQPHPLVVRAPGEVQTRAIKDLHPLDDVLAKFPGPQTLAACDYSVTAACTVLFLELKSFCLMVPSSMTCVPCVRTTLATISSSSLLELKELWVLSQRSPSSALSDHLQSMSPSLD
jgi:hypothetical protein